MDSESRRPPIYTLTSPFADLLGTTLAVDPTSVTGGSLASFLAEIREEISDSDRDFARLDAELRQAKEHRQRLDDFHASHVALMPPIHSLPDDMLLEIFTHSRSTLYYDAFRSGGGSCQRWTLVAEQGLPSLAPPRVQFAFALVVVFIRHQRHLLACRSCDISPGNFRKSHFRMSLSSSNNTISNVAIRHSSRWNVLQLVGYGDDIVNFCKNNNLTALDTLTSLTLDAGLYLQTLLEILPSLSRAVLNKVALESRAK